MKNLNKICTTEDWNDPEFLEMMQKILYFWRQNYQKTPA